MIANKRGKTDHRKRFSSLPLKLSAALFTESHRVSFIRLIAFLSSKINNARQRFFPLLARQQIQTGLQLNKKRKKKQSSRLSVAFIKPLCTLVPSYCQEAFECIFFLNVGILNKVKLYSCTKNSKPGFDFLARNMKQLVAVYQFPEQVLRTSNLDVHLR